MRKPNVPTMILVFALVAIGVVSGLAIATGFGAPGMPVVAFTPLPTTATPAAPATAVAAATTGSTAAAEASPTAGAAATTATSRPSATSGATATAEASATARASATSGASATARATATAQASATAVASEEFIEYTVQRGDTLNVIARRYGVTAEEIQALNNITDPRSLIVGTVLRIPAPAPTATPAVGADGFIEYTVQRGDTLNVIARRYGVTAEEIQALNNITDPRSLIVGTVLRIPRP